MQEADDRCVLDLGDRRFVSSSALSAIEESSNSNSAPTMLSMVSAALAAAASIMRESLSYSATTQSTPICEANFIFSAAC